MKPDLFKIRYYLDELKDAGLDAHDIAAALQLHQVKSNARAVRKWYSGKTTIRNVEFRALRDLTREVTENLKDR